MKAYECFCAMLDNMQEIYNYEEPYDNVICIGIVGIYKNVFEQSWKMMKEILEILITERLQWELLRWQNKSFIKCSVS